LGSDDARQSGEDHEAAGRIKGSRTIEVELTEQVVKQLRMDEKHHTVSELSHAGDEGGIVCHIVPPEKREALVVSLTHIRGVWPVIDV
jgi:hypothetical protein